MGEFGAMRGKLLYLKSIFTSAFLQMSRKAIFPNMFPNLVKHRVAFLKMILLWNHASVASPVLN